MGDFSVSGGYFVDLVRDVEVVRAEVDVDVGRVEVVRAEVYGRVEVQVSGGSAVSVACRGFGVHCGESALGTSILLAVAAVSV